MDFRQLFLSQHARLHAVEVGQPDFSNQELILRDLTSDHLRLRPHPGLNSLAWLFWHMTRGEDIAINPIIAGRSQVLEEGNWLARLKISQRDIATGMSDDEVEQLSQRVDIAALLAYRAAVGKQTQATIRELQPEVLDEKIGDDLIRRLQGAGVFGSNAGGLAGRWLGKVKGYALMHIVLAHSYFHIGQCEDIRGLLGFRTL